MDKNTTEVWAAQICRPKPHRLGVANSREAAKKLIENHPERPHIIMWIDEENWSYSAPMKRIPLPNGEIAEEPSCAVIHVL